MVYYNVIARHYLRSLLLSFLLWFIQYKSTFNFYCIMCNEIERRNRLIKYCVTSVVLCFYSLLYIIILSGSYFKFNFFFSYLSVLFASANQEGFISSIIITSCLFVKFTMSIKHDHYNMNHIKHYPWKWKVKVGSGYTDTFEKHTIGR